MQLTEHVSFELQDRVAQVRLTRPDARNALSDAIAQGLVEVARRIESDRAVRAVVVAGEGDFFCAGGDLKAFARGGINAEHAHAVHFGLLGLHRAPVPVVAAIEGGAIGYGMGLASACDIRIAAAGSRFQAGFTGIGLSPDSTTSYFLPRLLGLSRATAFMLSNLPVLAEELHAAGYLAQVVEKGRAVETATALAVHMAHMPSAALRRAKVLLQESLLNTAEAHIERELAFILETFPTPDFAEGVNAFVEKRKPDFAAERQD